LVSSRFDEYMTDPTYPAIETMKKIINANGLVLISVINLTHLLRINVKKLAAFSFQDIEIED
jgi:hypothetical protein